MAQTESSHNRDRIHYTLCNKATLFPSSCAAWVGSCPLLYGHRVLSIVRMSLRITVFPYPSRSQVVWQTPRTVLNSGILLRVLNAEPNAHVPVQVQVTSGNRELEGGSELHHGDASVCFEITHVVTGLVWVGVCGINLTDSRVRSCAVTFINQQSLRH